MTIRKRFQAIFIGLFSAMAIACAANIWAVWSMNAVTTVEDRRLASLQLADELRQSSDDLTRMARSFAATHDPLFAGYFQDILDIRAGMIPYPEGYSGIFWDFMIQEKTRLNHEGQAISLTERMKQLGFSQSEFAKLKEAETKSNDLANLETKAMNAIFGQFDDGSGNYTVIDSPDQKMAIRLLFGEQYHNAKATIMKPIQDFFDLLEQRTSSEISAIRGQQQTVVTGAFAAIIVTLCLTIYAFLTMNRTVISPLGFLRDAVAEFGVTRAAADLPHLDTRDEIGEIATGFTSVTREVADYISSINEARSELKQNEKEISEREERIRSLLEVSPIGFSLTRLTGELLLTNDAFRKILQLAEETVTALDMGTLYRDPEDRKRYVDILQRKEAVSGFEVVWKRVDGSPVWVTISSRLIDFGGDKAILAWIDDITERKGAEQKIRRSEETFKSVVNQLPAAIGMKDMDGGVLLTNTSWQDWFGGPAHIPIGATADDIYTEDVAAEIREIDNRIKETGEIITREMYQTFSDGTDHTLQMTKFPIRDTDGTIFAIASVDIDITERKKAEHEIAAKEAQFRMALDNMPGAMWVVDKELNLVFGNEQYKDYYDDPDGLFVPGAHMPTILQQEAESGHLGGEGTVDDIVEQRLASYRCDCITSFEDKATDGRDIKLIRRPTNDGFVVSVATDITEQKKAERELANNMAELRNISNTASDAIITINENSEISSWNLAATKIFGYSSEEAIGQNLELIIPEHLRQAHVEGVSHITKGGEGKHSGELLELEGRRKSGEIFPVELSLATWCGESGRVFSGILRDITERKKAEVEIATKEAQLRAALDNMSSGMLMFDKENSVVLFNEQYRKLFDFPEDLIVVGASAENSVRYQANRGDFGDGDVDDQVKRVMDILTGGKATTYERKLITEKIVDINLSPTPDDGTVVVYNDITDRKFAELQLQNAFNLISSSIDYASKIQRSVLPDNTLFTSFFSDHFVLWEPRDVVGGDIYWCRQWGDGLLVILVDCTGHGVPGAFMTLIATGALDSALTEIQTGDAAGLTQRIHQLVQITLGQHEDSGESDDGLELGMCYLESGKNSLTFVGARFELYLVENGEVTTIRGTKSGIGYCGISHTQEFEEHNISNLSGKSIYMTSDAGQTH